MYIVLEGIDGSGKTTQCKMLKNALAKMVGSDKVVLTSNPGTSEPGNFVVSDLGNKIRNEFLPVVRNANPMILTFLMMSVIVDNYINVIKPALKSRKIVICDMSSMSQIVYQGTQGNITIRYLLELHGKIAEGLGENYPEKPLATIVLHASEKTCKARGKLPNNGGSCDPGRLRRGYIKLLDQIHPRGYTVFCQSVFEINTDDLSEQEVHEKIMDIVKSLDSPRLND